MNYWDKHPKALSISMAKLDLFTHVIPAHTLEKYAINNIAIRHLPETFIMCFATPDTIGFYSIFKIA